MPACAGMTVFGMLSTLSRHSRVGGNPDLKLVQADACLRRHDGVWRVCAGMTVVGMPHTEIFSSTIFSYIAFRQIYVIKAFEDTNTIKNGSETGMIIPVSAFFVMPCLSFFKE
jgi:hypothetical protein